MTNRPDQTREKTTRTERPDVDRPGETPRSTSGTPAERTPDAPQQSGTERGGMSGTTGQPGSKSTGGQRGTSGDTERGSESNEGRTRNPGMEERDATAADEDRDVTGEDDSDRESRIDKEGGRGATNIGNPRP